MVALVHGELTVSEYPEIRWLWVAAAVKYLRQYYCTVLHLCFPTR